MHIILYGCQKILKNKNTQWTFKFTFRGWLSLSIFPLTLDTMYGTMAIIHKSRFVANFGNLMQQYGKPKKRLAAFYKYRERKS